MFRDDTRSEHCSYVSSHIFCGTETAHISPEFISIRVWFRFVPAIPTAFMASAPRPQEIPGSCWRPPQPRCCTAKRCRRRRCLQQGRWHRAWEWDRLGSCGDEMTTPKSGTSPSEMWIYGDLAIKNIQKLWFIEIYGDLTIKNWNLWGLPDDVNRIDSEKGGW